MLIFTMAVATAHATTDIKNEKKDTGISIESKEKKVSTYKITWNANGGKIGTKKTKVTSVRKGSKIGKLTIPKRSGYGFKGWFTKKTGGTKISKNTKPKKSTTLYAIWTKKSSSRVLNAEEKKLVGTWGTTSVSGGVYESGTGSYQYPTGTGISYSFNADGTCYQVLISYTSFSRSQTIVEGSWSVS